MSKLSTTVALVGCLWLAVAFAQADQQHLRRQRRSLGPGCAEQASAGSQRAMTPQPGSSSGTSGSVRVRRQAATQPAPAANPNPLGFLTDLGPQVERIQSAQKMFSAIFPVNNPNQAAAANQIQQAFQPQPAVSPISPVSSASTLMRQLTDMVQSAQDRSARSAATAQQQVQSGAQQALQSSQQQIQQTQGGIQSALAEIGTGLQKIAMNNPSLLPDIKNLYSSVSSKLSSASSSITQPASFPSSGPIVPAKNGDQLIDNLGKVAMGQTQ